MKMGKYSDRTLQDVEEIKYTDFEVAHLHFEVTHLHFEVAHLHF